MSPKDIKLNYFFNDPEVKLKELSDYLHYSIEDDLYFESEEESSSSTDDSSQNSPFFEPDNVLNETNIDDWLDHNLEFSGVRCESNQKDKFTEYDETETINMAGNYLTDAEIQY
ncbi:MAG: hypothetical protein KA270_16020 [Saprospiraceae bacterium]|nr:hypothetical protein [Saprospiraceae bacterium]MBP6568679.1 hypothetical protein [Saprospiraceae bacterium]